MAFDAAAATETFDQRQRREHAERQAEFGQMWAEYERDGYSMEDFLHDQPAAREFV